MPVSTARAASASAALSLDITTGTPSYICIDGGVGSSCDFTTKVTVTGTGFPSSSLLPVGTGVQLAFQPTVVSDSTSPKINLDIDGKTTNPSIAGPVLANGGTSVLPDANGWFMAQFVTPVVPAGTYHVYAMYTDPATGQIVMSAPTTFTITPVIGFYDNVCGGNCGIYGDQVDIAGAGFGTWNVPSEQVGTLNGGVFGGSLSSTITTGAIIDPPYGYEGACIDALNTGSAAGCGAGAFETDVDPGAAGALSCSDSGFAGHACITVGDISGGPKTVNFQGLTTGHVAVGSFTISPSLQFFNPTAANTCSAAELGADTGAAGGSPTLSFLNQPSLAPAPNGQFCVVGHNFDATHIIAGGNTMKVGGISTSHGTVTTNALGVFPGAGGQLLVTVSAATPNGQNTVVLAGQSYNFTNFNVVNSMNNDPGAFGQGVGAPCDVYVYSPGCEILSSVFGSPTNGDGYGGVLLGSEVDVATASNIWSSDSPSTQGGAILSDIQVFGTGYDMNGAAVDYNLCQPNVTPVCSGVNYFLSGSLDVGSFNSLPAPGPDANGAFWNLYVTPRESCCIPSLGRLGYTVVDTGNDAFSAQNNFFNVDPSLSIRCGQYTGNVPGVTCYRSLISGHTFSSAGLTGLTARGRGFFSDTPITLTVKSTPKQAWPPLGLVGALSATALTGGTVGATAGNFCDSAFCPAQFGVSAYAPMTTIGTTGAPVLAGGKYTVNASGSASTNWASASFYVKPTALPNSIASSQSFLGFPAFFAGATVNVESNIIGVGCGAPPCGVQGLQPNTQYNIVWDPGTDAKTVATFTSTAQGTIPTGTITFAAPAGTPGLHVVDIQAAGVSAYYNNQVDSIMLTDSHGGVPSYITQFPNLIVFEFLQEFFTPSAGPLGTSINLVGGSLPPNTKFTVVGPPGFPYAGVVFNTFTSDASGNIPSGVTVAVPKDVGCCIGGGTEQADPLTFNIIGPNGNTAAPIAFAAYTAQASASLSPSSGAAGSSVTLTAFGLDDVTPGTYNIIWNWQQGASANTYTGTVVGSLTAQPGTGLAQANFNVPASALPGTYAVTLVSVNSAFLKCVGTAITQGCNAIAQPPTFAVGGVSGTLGTGTLTPGSASQTTLSGYPAVSIAYTNTLSSPLTAIAFGVVKNGQGQIVDVTTSTLQFAASGSATAYLVLAGLPSGSYTVSMFVVSSTNVVVSTTSNTSVSF